MDIEVEKTVFTDKELDSIETAITVIPFPRPEELQNESIEKNVTVEVTAKNEE